MSFLKAEWRKLILVNYEVDQKVLTPYLPAKTELDLHNGKCMVSLVGFKFVNTKMLGLKIPFHINFEEVNLRFYVKHKAGNDWKRGVVFIKEIVPKRAISIVAVFTFLNPHVYLDTVILIGSISQQFADNARVCFAIGASSASFVWFFGIAYGSKLLTPLIQNPLYWRILDLIIALIMFIIAFNLASQGSWL